MIKVTSIALNSSTMKATVSLFSDTKNEVTSDAKIVGLPDGYSIDFGSSCLTASGELAFMKSDGTWNWT